MQKNQKVIIGGVVILVGAAYALSQKGEDSAAGKMGSIISSPIEAFSGAPDTGVDPGKSVGETISGIFEGLPVFEPPPGMPGMGAMQVAPTGNRYTDTKTKKSILATTATSPTAIIGAQAGAYTVMKPVQLLAGSAAKTSQAIIKYPMAPSVRRKYEKQQKARVKKYPRASHAVSMLTGGVTAKAPVTKKQEAARQQYPTVYKVWKTAFSWLGA